jgi:hypothetical protein
MIKDNSIKLIVMIAKKIILQKKIIKYQASIDDIDEYLQDKMESTRNLKDFEHIFNQLKSEYKNKLIDTSDDDNDNDDMEIVKSNDNNK